MAELRSKAAESPNTILVVDDADCVLNVVAAILRAAHFHVLQAESGSDALRVAADYQGRIDVLLSDVKMPGMSGIELGAMLTRMRPEMNVVFMSGFTTPEVLMLGNGFAFIGKPFVARKLVDTISHALQSPKARRN